MKKVSSLTTSENANHGKVNACVSILVALSFIRIALFQSFWNYESNYMSVLLSFASAFTIFIAVILVHKNIARIIKILGALLIVSFVVSFFIHRSGFEYICNSVTILGLMAVLPYTKLKWTTVGLFTVVFAFYGLLLVLFAPKFGEDATALININTNESSYIMFYLMCIMFAFAIRSKHKIIAFTLAIVALICQISFVGRSTLLGTLIFIFCVALRKITNKARRKTVRNLQFVLCIMAIAFAYFYAVILYNAAGYGSIIIFGKDIFTGRQIIWNEAFERIKGHLLFGIGNVLTAGDYIGTVNMHNQMVGYLVCFGLITTVLIIVLTGLLTARIFERNQSNLSVAFISTVIIMSYFETIFYASVHVTIIIVPLIVIYTIDRKKQSNGVKFGNKLLLARSN